ncbi:MAG: hypothetical protein CVU22_06295 [Betaproteobacteria bacterium HGW-Betaproteobacteria-16]|nr:MAG: hypothetical protein CVU22_06295 [Betaproteobacteria bacterium HGW-Betaproteobacteria-16]
MPLAPFILALVGGIVGRVLASLGMGVITIIGVDIAIDQLKDAVTGAAASLPADVLALFLLAGGGIGINMVFGAITFRLTYWTITKSVRLIGISS